MIGVGAAGTALFPSCALVVGITIVVAVIVDVVVVAIVAMNAIDSWWGMRLEQNRKMITIDVMTFQARLLLLDTLLACLCVQRRRWTPSRMVRGNVGLERFKAKD